MEDKICHVVCDVSKKRTFYIEKSKNSNKRIDYSKYLEVCFCSIAAYGSTDKCYDTWSKMDNIMPHVNMEDTEQVIVRCSRWYETKDTDDNKHNSKCNRPWFEVHEHDSKQIKGNCLHARYIALLG